MKNVKSDLWLFVFTVFSLLFFSHCGSVKQGASGSGRTTQQAGYATRRLLLRDEGLSQLAYVDLANSTKNWYVKVPAGRDLQLVGKGHVLIGTGTGYEEREIKTGNKIFETTSFNGTIAARRLRNGNTLLTGLNWQGKKGIVLMEIDKKAAIKRVINFPAFSYVRLVRETAAGTFLITADDIVFEGSTEGNIIWQAKLTGREKPHAWQALRLTNGQTIVSGGYTAGFQLFDASGNFISAITGPAEVKPNFYAGFQIMESGNYVVTNWQGHGAAFGAIGTQLLEYDAAGKLVWSWKQDAAKFSSLQGVIVLDGLDINELHVEDGSGKLKPVK